MDSVIYIPDNTSNPKTFCLQYKKGTNTYAVDNNSAVAKGVCLANLISNGDFRNGTTGWTVNADLTTANNEATLLATFQYSSCVQVMPLVPLHKYYFSVWIKSTTVNAPVLQGDNVNYTGDLTYPSGSGVYERLSLVRTIPNPTNQSTSYFAIRDNRASGWDPIKLKEFVGVDLTATFGAGNEPTASEMDTIMANYPNSWFNITAKTNL